MKKKTKVCSKCKKRKARSEFSFRGESKDGLRSYCRDCERKQRREYFKQYYKKHKEKYQERSKKRDPQRSPHRTAANRNLTLKQREDFIAIRGSCCEVCGISREVHREMFKKDICIDHCHKTNINKGVLCMMCNSAAGRIKDNPNLAWKLFQYLKRTRKEN